MNKRTSLEREYILDARDYALLLIRGREMCIEIYGEYRAS